MELSSRELTHQICYVTLATERIKGSNPILNDYDDDDLLCYAVYV